MKLKIFESFAKAETKAETKEDAFVKLVGHFGRWQFVIFATIMLVKLSSGWVQFMILFLTPHLTFWCEEFKSNGTKIGDNMTCYPDCVKYGYDASPLDNTIVSEWDLICERQWLASFTQTVLQFGVLIGSIIFGFLSDRYGRRYTFLTSITLLIIFGFLIPFSTSYTLFTVYRFFLGVATAGTMVVSFVIVIETIGARYREVAGCLFHIPFIIGHLTTPLFAYYLRDWSSFTLGLAIPPVMYLGYFVVITESPRWLISVGKVEQAVEVITKAAKMNNLPTANIREVVTKLSTEARNNKSEEARFSYIDLFRTPALRVRTFCCCAIWFVSGLSFFGVNQYISQTSPNPFLSVAAAALIQIPANLLAMWLIRVLGRRATVAVCFTLGGICILILGWVPSVFWVTLTLGTFGVSFVALVCTAIYIYSTELFPTVVRNMGLGLSSTAMRVGSMLAPFVSGLSVKVPWLPPVVFGVAPIVAALLCLALPETKGQKLPDAVDDIEC